MQPEGESTTADTLDTLALTAIREFEKLTEQNRTSRLGERQRDLFAQSGVQAGGERVQHTQTPAPPAGRFMKLPLRAPPSKMVAFPESMLQADRAAALRRWLATAENIQAVAQKKVDEARHEIELMYSEHVASLENELDTAVAAARTECVAKIAAATAQHRERLAAADADRNRMLAKCRVPGQEDLRQQIVRLRSQAEEAEQLAVLLQGAAVTDTCAPEPLDELVCPIAGEVMRDPVILSSCAHTFDREAIEEWLDRHSTCPECHGQTDGTLTPNLALKKTIQDLPA